MINVLYEQMIASIAIYLYFAKMIQQITAGKHQNIHDPLLFQNEHHHLVLYRSIGLKLLPTPFKIDTCKLSEWLKVMFKEFSPVCERVDF